jgi:hypothetical protein
MIASDADNNRLRISYFVPVELQRRGFHQNPAFSELAQRAFQSVDTGKIQLVHPWCRWHGLSTYLDCVAYAERSAKTIPNGRDLTLEHVTPGQFYSASIIVFAQALTDNIAVWLCDALSLPVRGGERHFLSSQFQRELKKKEPSSAAVLTAHQLFVKEVNAYRQVWIHTIAGGALPTAAVNPFEQPQTDDKFLGIPIDPAIHPDEKNYLKRVEACASAHDGQYLYKIGDFATRIFNGASEFYLDWLRFSLQYIT